MENIKFTKEEQETIECLIKLGDSKKLAIETVISQRISEKQQKEKDNFYRFAYEN